MTVFVRNGNRLLEVYETILEARKLPTGGVFVRTNTMQIELTDFQNADSFLSIVRAMTGKATATLVVDVATGKVSALQ